MANAKSFGKWLCSGEFNLELVVQWSRSTGEDLLKHWTDWEHYCRKERRLYCWLSFALSMLFLMPWSGFLTTWSRALVAAIIFLNLMISAGWFINFCCGVAGRNRRQEARFRRNEIEQFLDEYERLYSTLVNPNPAIHWNEDLQSWREHAKTRLINLARRVIEEEKVVVELTKGGEVPTDLCHWVDSVGTNRARLKELATLFSRFNLTTSRLEGYFDAAREELRREKEKAATLRQVTTATPEPAVASPLQS